MAIVQNVRTVRLGPLPGKQGMVGSRIVSTYNGHKHVPYVKKLAKLPLSYTAVHNHVLSYQLSPRTDELFGPAAMSADRSIAGDHSSTGSDLFPIVVQNRCRNRARNKLLSRLANKQAEWMTSLAETRSTVKMINGRATQLQKAASFIGLATLASVRRAETTLRVRRRLPKKRIQKYLRLRNLAGLWLEYWMGWAPLAGDVWQGLKNISEARFDAPFIVSGASGSEKKGQKSSGSGTNFRFSEAEGTLVCAIRCAVKGFNPNTALAKSLGLVNPFKTIYDIMPFSWMLGWFVNISEVIGSYSDLYGVDIEKNSVSETYFSRQRQTTMYTDPTGVNSREIYQVYMWRNVQATLPTARLNADFSGLSLTRAATAASLLVLELFRFGNKR